MNKIAIRERLVAKGQELPPVCSAAAGSGCRLLGEEGEKVKMRTSGGGANPSHELLPMFEALKV
jgi:hypothetical protein